VGEIKIIHIVLLVIEGDNNWYSLKLQKECNQKFVYLTET